MEENKIEKELTPADARRMYDRTYYAKHKEQIKRNKQNYWARKAAALNAALAESEVPQQ